MNKTMLCLALACLLVAGCTEPTESEPVIVETEKYVVSLETVPEKECLGVFEITGYCACETCCGAWADGIAYTGGLATEGQTIAVDPAVIPLGSVVEINGRQYIAEDIGAGINGKEIDLFFCSHEDAWNWGRQIHEVYLVK